MEYESGNCEYSTFLLRRNDGKEKEKDFLLITHTQDVLACLPPKSYVCVCRHVQWEALHTYGIGSSISLSHACGGGRNSSIPDHGAWEEGVSP